MLHTSGTLASRNSLKKCQFRVFERINQKANWLTFLKSHKKIYARLFQDWIFRHKFFMLNKQNITAKKFILSKARKKEVMLDYQFQIYCL